MRNLILVLAISSNLAFGITGNKVWRIPSGGTIPSWGPVNLADTTNAITGSLGRGNLPAVGQTITSSSGSYTLTNTSGFTDITNLSVTLTTTGRPVVVQMIAGGASTSQMLSTSSSSQLSLNFDTSTELMRQNIGATQIPCSSLYFIHVPSAASHTYKIQGNSPGGGLTLSVTDCKLVVYEL